VDPNASKLSDISSLIGTDLSGRQFPGTVVSSHEFGVFVELDEYGCEGLVPQSMLPRGESKPKPRARPMVAKRSVPKPSKS
jgi:exoribonuclease R